MQLHPYGWQQPDGSVIREAFYSNMVAGANASYFRWINPYPQHSYFRRFVPMCRLQPRVHMNCMSRIC